MKLDVMALTFNDMKTLLEKYNKDSLNDLIAEATGGDIKIETLDIMADIVYMIKVKEDSSYTIEQAYDMPLGVLRSIEDDDDTPKDKEDAAQGTLLPIP